MNCENCKNKQASVFYADEGGGRHALCQSCARTLGRISQYSPSDETPQSKIFIPTPTLTSLSIIDRSSLYYHRDEQTDRVTCPSCATSLESAVKRGKVGCPECYTVFAEALFPSALSAESAPGARMPSSRRALIDRARRIKELKAEIKIAVESENYELAATLRDKIRKLENTRKA